MTQFRLLSLVAASLLTVSVWSGSAGASEIELDGAQGITDAELRQGPLRVHLYYNETPSEPDWQRAPSVELFVDGSRVSAINDGGNGFEWPGALAQVVEMDKSNPYPEVVFATYSGGAHCCNVRRIITSSTDGSRWRVVELGPVDGGISGARDADYDGVYEIVHPDNNFFYMFSSYAGSFAPQKVFALREGKMVDLSADPRFEALHRESLRELQPMIDDIGSQYEKNGLLAGYVALKTLLGEGAEAWQVLRANYDRKSDWGLKQCTGGYDQDNTCRAETTYRDFPTALEAFLRQTGYVR